MSMKKSYILNMAMRELLRKIGKEQNFLKEHPESIISKVRLSRYFEEEKELHELIIIAEKTEF